ncbi:hypothetical protein QCM8_278 [Bacillus phage QCM8]|nr:hypothetical protein QCM8_2 [Bacillus phage QCM8]AOZ62196.1 hypothetical protein QCM8_278 [Bacillus phage QCM8]
MLLDDQLIYTYQEPKQFDIGGVFTLVLVEGENGLHGEYTNHKTRTTYSYDGAGLSQKKILKQFWDKAKAIDPAAAYKWRGSKR